MLAPEEEKFYQDFLAVVAQKWRPTKAAFYTLDPGGAVFRLKAQFGFTRGDRLAERLGRNEPLVNQIYEHREPTFINNVNQAGRLADAMIQSTSTRMLVAPLYLDGRIMGLVDMRDKAGRVAFSHDDALEVADLLRRFAVELRRLSDARAVGAILREPPPVVERPLDPPTPPSAMPSPLEKTSGFAAIPAVTSGIYRRAPQPPLRLRAGRHRAAGRGGAHAAPRRGDARARRRPAPRGGAGRRASRRARPSSSSSTFRPA